MQSTKYTMSLYQAKMRARAIRDECAHKGEKISHSQALERVSKELGYRNWNTAIVRLSNHPDIEVQIGDHVHGTYLKQPFTGRILSVSEQGGGSHYRIEIDLDEAVDVVTFDSFSSLRKRVHGQIDAHGNSPAKTSDGVPQLVVLGHVHH